MNRRHPHQPALISIVSPVYNEEKNVPLFHQEVERVFAEFNTRDDLMHPYEWEIIFVNDGSHDQSWAAILEAGQKDARVKGVCFSRNFGHQPAIEAGMHEAKGQAIVTIDADMEDPPSLIPTLVEKWEAGTEIVIAKRLYSKERGFLKRKTSDLFYKVFNWLCDVKIESGTADFRLVDQSVVRALENFNEKELFFRGLFTWLGFTTATVSYQKGERMHGTTGYTLKKMLRLAWTGLSGFSTFPLRFIMMSGFSITLLSVLLLSVMAILRWVTETVAFQDMAFLVVFIIFSNGLILTAIGVVALYLMQIYRQVLGRPTYIVWKRNNF